jgi:ferrous-iron efflux pump FieF
LSEQIKDNTTEKSSVAKAGTITGGIAFLFAIVMAVTANSLALWADMAATLLDFLAVFIAWQGFKKVETKSTELFNYGYGKFESFASMSMSILMVFSFLCIMAVSIMRFQHPVPVEGFGVILGIILHLLFGFINGSLLYKTIALEKKDKSFLISAQRRIYFVKFSANVLMFGSMILAYFFGHLKISMFADPIVATFIAILILANASKIFRYSSRDLLGYALEEQSQLLILRSLANHFDHYESIKEIRSRVSGGKVYVELFLEFDGSLLHSKVLESIKSLESEITDLLKCDEVLIIPI